MQTDGEVALATGKTLDAAMDNKNTNAEKEPRADEPQVKTATEEYEATIDEYELLPTLMYAPQSSLRSSSPWATQGTEEPAWFRTYGKVFAKFGKELDEAISQATADMIAAIKKAEAESIAAIKKAGAESIAAIKKAGAESIAEITTKAETIAASKSGYPLEMYACGSEKCREDKNKLHTMLVTRKQELRRLRRMDCANSECEITKARERQLSVEVIELKKAVEIVYDLIVKATNSQDSIQFSNLQTLTNMFDEIRRMVEKA
ncbi:uncharacterized protein LOC126574391 [Anopheles aquasalis]|uniref:uncharacterized protein LOC126574391 n=1 Tax=Anopheles aquasalis TaxID=42839 RepID=UPI00215A77D3|nr:uncharacterized protein LOC126574391 [Anopheles aquasalis]